jgi:predicted transposase YbfD/YdcC
MRDGVITDVNTAFLTSVPATVASAQQLLAIVRGHWCIGNGLHYRRDVTLHEDASQVRMGQLRIFSPA